MRLLLLVIAVLFGLSPVAWAGDCRLESSTCVDTSASKTISGVVVTLADVGGCWEFQDNYTCIKPNSIDYCSALTAAGCGQTSSVCRSGICSVPSSVGLLSYGSCSTLPYCVLKKTRYTWMQ